MSKTKPPPAVTWSLPARERGSKHVTRSFSGNDTSSLPARERGSKRPPLTASHVLCRRSPRGSADRNTDIGVYTGHYTRRSPRGSADRNIQPDGLSPEAENVAPRAGARIETCRRRKQPSSPPRVAPRAGARIETTLQSRMLRPRQVAPRAGARIETAPSAAGRCARRCRSPRGSADRNQMLDWPLAHVERVAPRAGARIETAGNQRS